MCNTVPGLEDYSIADSVEAFNTAYLKCIRSAYYETKHDWRRIVESLLRETDDLRQITAEAIVKDGRVLGAIRNACTPPISKERLAAITDVPARRFSLLENGRLPLQGALMKRMVETELPAVVEVVKPLICDRNLTPWLLDSRACSADERDAFVDCLLDRIACSESDHIARAEMRWLALSNVACKLAELGFDYVEYDEGDGSDSPLIPPTQFTYGMDCDFVLNNTDGSTTCIDLKMAGDAPTALRSRSVIQKKLKALADNQRKYGVVLYGFYDKGVAQALLDAGVEVAWLCDLESIRRFGPR